MMRLQLSLLIITATIIHATIQFSPLPLYLPAPGRVVAVGDVHGDASSFLTTLKIAGLIDPGSSIEDATWTGGDATLVQCGDILDRGAEEAECWELLQRLKAEAPQTDGRVVALLGNHEVLNVLGKAGNYVHPMGRSQFGEDRCAAFQPGGDLAQLLAEFPIFAIIGDSCFVHASLPRRATRPMLERINMYTRRWLLGEGGVPLALLGGRDSPVWDRTYSYPYDEEVWCDDCDELGGLLRDLGVSRLVLGHTPQTNVNSACDGKVWRCDTGQSRWVMGGACEALEICKDGTVRVLRESSPHEGPRGAETASRLTDEREALDAPACASGDDVEFYN